MSESAEFKRGEIDYFRPKYGDVNWVRLLNKKLEENDLECSPVFYEEQGKEPMQITQENTMIYWNTLSDELDTVAIMYEPDNGKATWYFRDRFLEIGTSIEDVTGLIGAWSLQTMSLYPMSHVVDVYESLNDRLIPDSIPEDFV